jgi:hypothetical protein
MGPNPTPSGNPGCVGSSIGVAAMLRQKLSMRRDPNPSDDRTFVISLVTVAAVFYATIMWAVVLLSN